MPQEPAANEPQFVKCLPASLLRLFAKSSPLISTLLVQIRNRFRPANHSLPSATKLRGTVRNGIKTEGICGKVCALPNLDEDAGRAFLSGISLRSRVRLRELLGRHRCPTHRSPSRKKTRAVSLRERRPVKLLLFFAIVLDALAL